jgi:hypothetical protein
VHAYAQEDKKTDDDKPADPDTGESTVEETTLGLLPNPLQKYGIKFADKARAVARCRLPGVRQYKLAGAKF